MTETETRKTAGFAKYLCKWRFGWALNGGVVAQAEAITAAAAKKTAVTA